MTGETFGQLLRRLRTSRPGQANGNRFGAFQACMSQNELATRAEIDPAYVNRLEMDRPTDGRAARSQPSRAVVESLGRALRLSPIDMDRLLIAAGYWPWPEEPEDVERALAAVHGDFYAAERRSS